MIDPVSLAVGLTGCLLAGMSLWDKQSVRRRLQALEEPDWEWSPMGFDLSGTLDYPGDPEDEDEDEEYYDVDPGEL